MIRKTVTWICLTLLMIMCSGLVIRRARHSEGPVEEHLPDDVESLGDMRPTPFKIHG
ncbi:hypothetical protein POX_c04593 [Penicillium oxalicum]|uniref:hypothetical protein n=1 Tax=Penicillium oxalicum TaxID=69781 RepID=UPI0020B7C1BF|nr:hypothetical protein POX_c04593 [Penicillium oxalicum]KAI2791718.1 hypothetical protein POX_c04593 [Penicillium oxalicum]